MRKVLEWAFCVWLIAVTGRFVSETWKTLQIPFNPGDDVSWFAGWIVLCTLLGIASFLLPVRTLFRGTLAICMLAGLTMLVLSGTWVAATVALWLLIICFGVGFTILGRLRIQTDSLRDTVVLALPTGMAALALVLFTLNVTQHLSAFWVVCVLVAGTLPCVVRGRSLRARFASRSREAVGGSALPFAFIAFSALLNLMWAVAPEVQFDALNYHLAMPKIYLNAGGLVDGRFLHAYFSRLLELLFVPALALGGQIAVKLFIYGLGLCAAAATYALGRALFDGRIGMWAAALFYTTPLVAYQTGTVYVDNIVALLSAVGLLMFVKWCQTKSAGWFPAICIVAGLATGSKLNAAFTFFLVLPAMAYGLRRQRQTVLLGCGVFLLLAAPVYAVTWAQTGNPVFPLLNGLFKSPLWPQVNTVFNSTQFGLPATLSNLPLFPFRLTLDTVRFGEAMPNGALGLSLLLAFPFAVCLLPRLGRAVHGVAATALVWLILLFYTMQYARYCVAILPAIAVLGAATAFQCPRPDNRIAQSLVRLCLVVAIVTQMPALTAQYWNIPERFPVAVAMGMESREAFSGRALDLYAAAMHINRTSAGVGHVLGAEVENVRFYLDVPLTTFPLSVLRDPSRGLSELKPGAELAAAIRQAGFTRMMARTAFIEKPPPWYPYFRKEFLDAYAILEFSDGGVSVYRLRE